MGAGGARARRRGAGARVQPAVGLCVHRRQPVQRSGGRRRPDAAHAGVPARITSGTRSSTSATCGSPCSSSGPATRTRRPPTASKKATSRTSASTGGWTSRRSRSPTSPTTSVASTRQTAWSRCASGAIPSAGRRSRHRSRRRRPCRGPSPPGRRRRRRRGSRGLLGSELHRPPRGPGDPGQRARRRLRRRRRAGPSLGHDQEQVDGVGQARAHRCTPSASTRPRARWSRSPAPAGAARSSAGPQRSTPRATRT